MQDSVISISTIESDSRHVGGGPDECLRLEEKSQQPPPPHDHPDSNECGVGIRTATSPESRNPNQPKHQHHSHHHHQHQPRKPKLKSQASGSVVSFGDGSVKSSERRYSINILFICYYSVLLHTSRDKLVAVSLFQIEEFHLYLLPSTVEFSVCA